MTSPSELILLRTQPHQTDMYMSVYKPSVVFTAGVSGTSSDYREITYSTISGSYTDIDADFTLLIGTTYGASDVGRGRVRSADATKLVVAENNDISWSNGQYLTA